MVSKNVIKGQRLQLNLRSLLSSLFVWGAIAQLIFCYDYEEDKPRDVLISDLLTLAYFLSSVSILHVARRVTQHETDDVSRKHNFFILSELPSKYILVYIADSFRSTATM